MNTRSYPILFGGSVLGMILLGTFALSLGIQHASSLSEPRAALPPLLAAAAGSALIIVSGFAILRLARAWVDWRRRQAPTARARGQVEQTPAAVVTDQYEGESQAIRLADQAEHDRTLRREVEAQNGFPSPATLAEYRTFGPEFVERVVTMAEREQLHRHWRERAPERTARLGVVCGLMIGIGGLGSACYLSVTGFPVVGAVLGAADMLALVGVFIYGSRQQLQWLQPSGPDHSRRELTQPEAVVPSRERHGARPVG